MIKTEKISDDLIRTYSDKNVLIHGGFPEGDYAEAIDPIYMNRTYVETDIPIETDQSEINAAYAEAGRILMGVSNDN